MFIRDSYAKFVFGQTSHREASCNIVTEPSNVFNIMFYITLIVIKALRI